MNFDSLIDYNAFIVSERPGWSAEVEDSYQQSYNAITAIVSHSGEMAVVALFAVAQDCIIDTDIKGD